MYTLKYDKVFIPDSDFECLRQYMILYLFAIF